MKTGPVLCDSGSVLALMLDGFLTIEEGQAKHRKAGGHAAEFEAFVKQHPARAGE